MTGILHPNVSDSISFTYKGNIYFVRILLDIIYEHNLDEIVSFMTAQKRSKGMSEIVPVESYPLPFEKESVIEIQESALEDEHHPIMDEDNIERTVDGFHERYIKEMVRTDEWSVFRNIWEFSDWVYFWNTELGYGFKVDGDWEVMCAFVEMMDKFTNEYDASDFEPANYSWEIP